ncbi:hypothetical protein H310_00528 [Aphanomyces invadans]|uniref:PWI domain-containing protein n=1 Tax=Aphanomyces invadans TaxID=157072 RepID=A0A024UWU2_9STRA|nr:hypothetical protein H310_00528 [Aphanomyces invadans]ETW10158.1 hypothetical protein H310_00528 [Aphanomyces invadans]|eukprot:XP_008861569.1 hypothetical protein H310_00528 [Aphanomyces invadans]
MNPPPRGPPPMLPFAVAPPMIPLGSIPMPPPMAHTVLIQPPVARVVQAPPEIGPLNVFVGKLPPDLHDNYVRNLLERVGTVVQWKRTTDPISGKAKAFGYCTYATALDCIRALKLLNGFSLDSKNILLKVDTTTQTKLDEYSAQLPPELQFEEDQKNERVAAMLQRLFEERSGLHGGYNNDIASWGDLMENVDSGAKEVVRGGMIMSEVEKFRLAQEERTAQLEAKRLALIQEKLRRDKEDAEKSATCAADNSVKEQEPKIETRNEPSRRLSPPRRGDRYRRSRSRSRDRRYRDSRRRSRSRSRSRDRVSRYRRNSSPGESSPRDSRQLTSAPPAPSASTNPNRDAATTAPRSDPHESTTAPPPQPPRRPVAKIELKLQKKDKSDAKPSVSAPVAVASAVFGVDDEETAKPQRDFVPLDYTDEEKLAASVEAQVARTVARINSRSDGVEGLIKSIPTDKKGLFKYPVDWSAAEKYKVVEEKMTPWVTKKIVEYLGEEESTLIGFVLRQLHQRTAPQAIVDELVPVLEQDAETFVLTMWRKLIFEVLRADGGN